MYACVGVRSSYGSIHSNKHFTSMTSVCRLSFSFPFHGKRRMVPLSQFIRIGKHQEFGQIFHQDEHTIDVAIVNLSHPVTHEWNTIWFLGYCCSRVSVRLIVRFYKLLVYG